MTHFQDFTRPDGTAIAADIRDAANSLFVAVYELRKAAPGHGTPAGIAVETLCAALQGHMEAVDKHAATLTAMLALAESDE
jgi:hypothetical protein